MEIIYLDQPLEAAAIQNALEALFPAFAFFKYNFIGDEPEGLELKNPDHIIFSTSFDDELKEFEFQVSIYNIFEPEDQQASLFIGRSFAERFGIRVLVPFCHPEYPINPYYCILFENGKTFLVYDFDTNFGDGAENLVKIVGEYDLLANGFDLDTFRADQ